MENHYRDIVCPPYRYRSEGPWRLAAEDGDGRMLEFTTFDTMFEAVAAFDRFHLPPLRHRTVGVYDENAQLIVYYKASLDGSEVSWGGTAEGYELLELIHDEPTAVVLWAAAARGAFNDLAST